MTLAYPHKQLVAYDKTDYWQIVSSSKKEFAQFVSSESQFLWASFCCFFFLSPWLLGSGSRKNMFHLIWHP